MMTLQEMMKAIDVLPLDDLLQLRTYIDQRASEAMSPAQELSPAERARRLREGFAQLREGLTQEQLDEITEAMNAEYIEPFDEDEWKD